jgi:hypothetical protein
MDQNREDYDDCEAQEVPINWGNLILIAIAIAALVACVVLPILMPLPKQNN